MRIGHRVLTAVAIALVLTVGIPSVASATVFFCGSGDVFCLIGSRHDVRRVFAKSYSGKTPKRDSARR